MLLPPARASEVLAVVSGWTQPGTGAELKRLDARTGATLVVADAPRLSVRPAA